MSEESDLTLSNILLDTRSFTVDLWYISGAYTIGDFGKRVFMKFGGLSKGGGVLSLALSVLQLNSHTNHKPK